MEQFSFQKLEVYQRSLALNSKLCKYATNLETRYRRLSDQLIGASSSIVLNIAEGSGRSSPKQFKQFLDIARGSIFECIALLDICSDLDIIKREQKESWSDELSQISQMLSGLKRSLS